jgi:hypothetical protein
MIEHEVRQGDCLNSIAKEYGFLWSTIWNYGPNATLKQKRKDPNILLPGDVVAIPDPDPKSESGGTEQVHSFKLKDDRCRFRVRLLINDKPRAKVQYQLEIDGKRIKGQTDADGCLEELIAPDARDGSLILPATNEKYSLALGHMDPITHIGGIQKRLQNLGFYIGETADGIMGPKTASGVRAFQHKYGLKVDGLPGPKTQAKLKEVYGC